jgi:AcrR family transcriptional regulator
MVGKTPLVGQEKPRRIDRRQAILDAATDLFAERGFGAVSVQ